MNRVLPEHKGGTSMPILGQGGFPKKVTSELRGLIIWDLSSSNLFIVADNSQRNITNTVSSYHVSSTVYMLYMPYLI